MLSIQQHLQGYYFVRFYITPSNIRHVFLHTFGFFLANFTFLNNIARQIFPFYDRLSLALINLQAN